nr:MAG TPA: hypothetical protein [Caudoviricetes sp.]
MRLRNDICKRDSVKNPLKWLQMQCYPLCRWIRMSLKGSPIDLHEG